MKRKKKFDCIKMKDDAQQRRAGEMRGFSAQERLEAYRRSHDALLRRQQKLAGNQTATIPGT